jgi:S1-C subfamily serine protease
VPALTLERFRPSFGRKVAEFTVAVSRRCSRVVYVAYILSCFSLSTAPAQTPRQIAEKTFPSVVVLLMEDSQGQPLSLGSGFFVRPGVIATNLHVAEGAKRGYAKLTGQKKRFEIAGVVGIDRKQDLILLQVPATEVPALPLGDSDKVGVGDSVYAVGNPEGLEATFSQGIVSGLRKLSAGNLIQITALISPGSSGGPVLNAEGSVIGIAVATYREGQNLNFAIPVSSLKTLLPQMKPVTPLSGIERVAKGSSISDAIGGKPSEGVVATHFTWEPPSAVCCEFTFSLHNQLQVPVRDVKYIVIFWDRSDAPVQVIEGARNPDWQFIPAGLAKRAWGFADESTRRLTARVEIRILGFTVGEDDGR